jgi:hypothetical protein
VPEIHDIRIMARHEDIKEMQSAGINRQVWRQHAWLNRLQPLSLVGQLLFFVNIPLPIMGAAAINLW